MKFDKIINDLLLEALTGDEIYNTYYKNIPYDVFFNLSKSDPQTVERDGKIQKIGRYVKLIIRMYLSKKLLLEDLPRVHEYLGYVYKHNVTLDLNKIKTLSDIYELIKNFIAKSAGGDLNKILSVLTSKDYKKVYDGNVWEIYVPLTEKGACYLGVSTDWCTAWGPNSLTKNYVDRSNLFTTYNQKGNLFIIINKNNNEEKYQFHFEESQYMDKNDSKINIKKFFQDNEEIKKYFFPSLYGKVSQEQLVNEMIKSDVLSSVESKMILKTAIEGGIENKLVNVIMTNDYESASKIFVDSNIVDDFKVTNRTIKIYLKKLTGLLSDVEYVISSYNNDKYNSGEHVYNDLADREWKWDEELGHIFRGYYSKNSESVRVFFGIPNYKMFASFPFLY